MLFLENVVEDRSHISLCERRRPHTFILVEAPLGERSL